MIKLKFYLVGYLIGLTEVKNIISLVDEMILEDKWHDSFTDLMGETFYENPKILELLKSENFGLSFEDFRLFELKYFPFLLSHISESTWNGLERGLYEYVKFKTEYLNLSSNDIDEDWFSIINDVELRINGLPGIINMPEGLTKIVLRRNEKIWDIQFIKNL